jgi:hypothetical protein
MKEVDNQYKAATLAIDFDGVVHKYSKGFQGLQNAYDGPNKGTREALEELIERGFRLIIVSSRPVDVINKWLEKQDMAKYFEEVTNIKRPASFYIDDHALYFDKNLENPWQKVLDVVKYPKNKGENRG